MFDFLYNNKRTHTCNDLRLCDVGKSVVLCGWVNSFRNHGSCNFIDLRDRYGITQIVCKAEYNHELYNESSKIRNEWCIGVKGMVEDRLINGGLANNKFDTGCIEVNIIEFHVFNKSCTLPFQVNGKCNAHEDKRLRYRILDLRRKKMQYNFMLRHKITQIVRNYFYKHNFLDIETPLMIKYTPGGARNFVVPSRLQNGLFFALAESPQLFKQMFMMAGFDRYFQIVKCCRDEDLRGNRQPEFTQIDIEMSFVTENIIMKYCEKLIYDIFNNLINVKLDENFCVMSYKDAMIRYSTDKPDIRFGLLHYDLTDTIRSFKCIDVPFFKQILLKNEIIKVMIIPYKYNVSRTLMKNLEKIVIDNGGSGLASAKVDNINGKWLQSPLSKFISVKYSCIINKMCNANHGDMILFQFGNANVVYNILNKLRLYLGRYFNLINESSWKALWINKFPLFKVDKNTNVYSSMHHPFTLPSINDKKNLYSNPESCTAVAYDLVINGCEIGGGSMRIYDYNMQKKIFDILGLSIKEQEKKFGFFLKSMMFGTPPHGGIALGLDRLCMLLCNSDNIRDVIAFPKSQTGYDLLTGAPSHIDIKSLKELNIVM